MKQILLALGCLLPLLAPGQGSPNWVIVHNQTSQNLTFSVWYAFNEDVAAHGWSEANQYSSGLIAAGTFGNLAAPPLAQYAGNLNGNNAIGSCQLWVTGYGNGAEIADISYNITGKLTGSGWVNDFPGGPVGEYWTGQTGITNIVATIKNPFIDKTVVATWTANGQVVKQETLLPGQSDTYVYTVPVGGTDSNLNWGYTVSGDYGTGNGANPFTGGNPNSDNPFGQGTTGIGYQQPSDPNAPPTVSGTGDGGGFTNGAGTVGSQPPTGTNAPLWTGATFTNNINYPQSDGTLAQDSTLRAVGGTLHQDNLNTLNGLGVLHQDLQTLIQDQGTNGAAGVSNVWVQNLGGISNLLVNLTNFAGQSDVLAQGITNQLGQNGFYLTVVTNGLDQVANALTNANALTGGLFTNSIDMNTKMGVFTNEAGQVVAYQAVLSNDLWMITQELTNLSGALTNPQISLALSNLSVNVPSNVYVLNLPTNYATEGTLEAVTGLLSSAFGCTNAGVSLDTNFGAYMSVTSDLAGYSVQYDGPTTYDAVVSAASSAADQSGLTVQETAFDTFVGNITDFSGNVLDTYPPVPMVIDFSAYGVPGGTMDLDPLHTDWGAELFNLAKQLFTWLIALGFLAKVTEEAWKAVFVIMGAHGINAQAVRTVIRNTGTSGLPGNPNV